MPRIPRFKQWDVAKIEWVDSAGSDTGAWTEVTKNLTEIHGTVTVGMVYEQRDDRITMVLSRDSDGMVAGIITIPLVAVTSIKRLESK